MSAMGKTRNNPAKASPVMTTQTKAILDAAQALPETERLLLVERLLEDLPLESDELTEEELYAELQRRRAEVQAGTVDGIPWSQLKQEGEAS
jgi:putative addiction module component (TIGR02574 family)